VTALQVMTQVDAAGNIIYQDVREDGAPLTFFDFCDDPIYDVQDAGELRAWIRDIPREFTFVEWSDLPNVVQREFVIAFWTPAQGSARSWVAHTLTRIGIWGPMRRLTSAELP
jgi:hypothetical protein